MYYISYLRLSTLRLIPTSKQLYTFHKLWSLDLKHTPYLMLLMELME